MKLGRTNSAKELEVIRTRRTGGAGRRLLRQEREFRPVWWHRCMRWSLRRDDFRHVIWNALGESTALDHAASKTFLGHRRGM